MGIFRQITVEGKVFLWHYGFDDDDCQLPSILVLKSIDRKGKIIIEFCTGNWEHGCCPFNKGLPATLDGRDTIINLNHPSMIAKIITYLMDKKLSYPLKQTVKYNGIDILHDMGYIFDYHLSWTNDL